MDTVTFTSSINHKIHNIDITYSNSYMAIINDDFNDENKKPIYITKARFLVNELEAYELINQKIKIVKPDKFDHSYLYIKTDYIILKLYIMNFKYNEWELVPIHYICYDNIRNNSNKPNCNIKFDIVNNLNYINKDLSIKFKFICLPNDEYKLFYKK